MSYFLADSSRPVVVLTGASSGIGRATARALARDGARLVLTARGIDGLRMAASECERAGGVALAVPGDVTDIKAMRGVAAAAQKRYGGIDAWINNVGVGAVGAFDSTPIEAHHRVIGANLLGHINGAHAVLPHFRQRKRGTLINMISVGGWAVAPYAAAYTASKFGLRGFSEALRAELRGLPDIHVCEVYPTFVDTPGFLHGANYTGKRLRPPPPLLDPRRVADALAALVKSPRAVTSIGSVAWPARISHAVAPSLTGSLTVWAADRALARADHTPVTDGNLFESTQGGEVDGGYRTAGVRAAPVAAAALLGALGLGLWWARERAK